MNSAHNTSNIPCEIWLEIFKLACMDGRSTWRALSLVSRLFYNLAKETRFHSVFVYGLSQLNALYSVLCETSPTYRRVHHFYFDMEVHPNDSESSKKELAAYRSNRAVFDFYQDHLYEHLMDMMSPTLETLHVYHRGFCGSDMLPPVSLPFLVELSFRGPFPVHVSENGHLLPVFPRLRYLHYEDFDDYPPDLFSRLARQAPSLTHLYLKPTRPSRRLYAELEKSLSRAKGEYPHPCMRMDFPFSVRRVYIEVGPEVFSVTKGTMNLHGMTLERLSSVTCGDTKVVVTINGTDA
ncbi:uncharacterized protein EV420DRAFT_1764677 [Desarmillaria tabescens]|uniref:F-box domain-containing protein n=1 Tax=Armillaria tabescens TaxID=1929756 RepID=A0AA39KB42_ARMTA|nr:uncharacterized protein EV420DRAFT_1764677 [Desarmillaria tabescens]KAK0457737.1 hypothetical protein EV420DRAFT_1764677 [Desarmillaria tabescens]